ncbi:MAG: sarcosine oxidase subunit alpha family protein [Rhizobiaceae bacterium]|nr:sarcosine oxidase subunit alpha family protein [Rhizobiaceae bacterium]
MSAYRLASGGIIDRDRPIGFTFDGRKVQGFAGDTIASALLANDIRLVGRSFKYHRPRGIWGFGSEEPNALVDVTGAGAATINNRATVIEARDGLVARSVNNKPDAASDTFAYVDRFSRFIPAAFYYKTFMFPNWHLFEPRIRAMAGLGTMDQSWKKTGLAAQINAHVDMLVIGGGHAGIAAALEAARAGRQVMLVDERRELGGALLHRDLGAAIDGRPAADWLAASVAELASLGVTILTDTTAFGIYDHNLVGLNQRHRDGSLDTLWRVRPKEIVLATGAIERPLPFANNDLPGVMSADAALVYLRRYGVVVGREIVIASNNSSTTEVGHALAEAGANVTIVELRADAAIPAGSDHAKLALLPGRRVVEASGGKAVTGVMLEDGTRLPCDALLVSGGWTPTIHLYGQAKGKLRWDETKQAFVPGTDVEGVRVVGAANGQFTLAEFVALPSALPGASPYTVSPAWPEPGQKGRVWIDLQNDVTAKDVELAARENFQSVEHLKRYTTLGMATDQGKTSNLSGLALMATLTGRTIPEVGTTTYRPPFTPVPIASFAGRRSGILFNPVRRLPLEASHREDGATFQEYGGWLRPAFYGNGDVDAEMQREAYEARQSVALFDGSTLGKIEVIGPQAAEFLDFIFYNTVSTLAPGKCRYCFILTESGIVYDDGVLVRLAPDHFIVSCSSSHVAGVHALLEDWRQDRFNRSQVFIHNATAGYATLTLTGPRSRDLLSTIDFGGAPLDDASLPHMAFVQGSHAGDPVRIARVSFTGDRSYEITIRADRAEALWRRLKAKGRDFDAILLGSEALLLLRAEKGYIIVGKDTDGATRPRDLGLHGPLRNKKVEFLGRRSLLLDEAQREARQEFVGLDVADGGPMLPAGAHGVEIAGGKHRSIGYVTSSYESPNLKRSIALGLIENGMSRHGDVIDIRHFGEIRKARIVQPCAFDPEGGRLNA